jgi:hypothetical protein
MGHAVGLDHAGAFEVELVIPQIGEKADAAAEQDGDEVYVDFVEKASLKVLLGDVRGADGNVALARDGAGLLKGCFDAVSDDGPISAWSDMHVGRVVSEQKERSTNGVVTAPAVGDVEGAPSSDYRPAFKHFLDHGAAFRGWLEAIIGADALRTGGPPVEQPASAVSEWIAGTVVGASDETVQ